MFIERLTGIFSASLPNGIIIETQGVGYGIEVPLSTMCLLPSVGQQISLWIYSYVREDSIRLFGFRSYEDRQAFEILLSLSGVGPKVALAILSTLTVNAIDRAVTSDDGKILESVPGVGPRLAEKIILDLRPKMMRLKAAQMLDLREEHQRLDAPNPKFNDGFMADNFMTQSEQRELTLADVQSALENLGYKDKIISPLLAALRKDSSLVSFQDLMRQALKKLSQGLSSLDSKRESSGVLNRGLNLSES